MLKKGVIQIYIKTACECSISWNPFDRIGHIQCSPLFEWLRIFLSEIDMNNLPVQIWIQNHYTDRTWVNNNIVK